MTTYRELHGKAIKTVTTNPSDDAAEGQIWFNSTDNTFKSIVSLEATSSGANLSTARAMCAGGGIQTASWLCGGTTGAPTVGTTHTENYDGNGWTTQGNLTNARAHFGATGPQTSGVAVGGGPPFGPSPSGAQNNTEEYGGSTWANGTAVPTNVWSNGMFGTQTAGVTVGSEPNGTNYVFEYDGSSWATGGTMNAIRSYVGSTGTLTAGMVFAGLGPPPNTSDMIATELYDGTNWTTAPNLNTGGTYSPFSGGSQTSAIKAGGINTPSPPGSSAVIERYDGSSWSTSPATLATGRGYSKGQSQNSPSNTAAVFAGGATTYSGNDSVSSTEEFNVSANVITAAAFSSIPSLNSARWVAGAAGTKAAGIVFGGRNPPIGQDLALSEEFNGTSWSEGPDLGQNRRVMGRGTGTSTAALAHGGHYGSPSTRYKVAEEWNGSTWANGGTSTNAHDGTMQIGTQTAAASCGGYNGTNINKTESYNGTSFSTAEDMTYSAYVGGGSGPQTAAVVYGGGFPSVTNSNEYDGTNWTAGNTLLTVTSGFAANGGGGAQTAAIGAGGYGAPGGGTPSYKSAVFTYDGTVFSTAPSLGSARYSSAGQGSNSSFFIAGGLAPPGSATGASEEFTAETTAINVKTLTQS